MSATPTQFGRVQPGGPSVQYGGTGGGAPPVTTFTAYPSPPAAAPIAAGSIGDIDPTRATILQ